MIIPIQRRWHRAAAAFAVALTLVESGCVTSRAIRNYEGDAAILRFRLVSNEMPAPRIYWRESPPHAETLLTIRPPASGCDTVSIYVNPTAESPNLLGDKTMSVAPADPGGAGQWRFIPDTPCTVLLLAGESDESGFAGLSFSTPAGEFDRRHIDLARDRIKSGDDKIPAYLWPVAVLMVPVYAAVGVTTAETLGLVPRKEREFGHAVTVSFDFPDGSRKETQMREDEAIEILKGRFYHDGAVFPADSYNSNTARFWIRAALLKLELDFREEQAAQWNEEHDAEYSTLALVSVGGIDGDWLIDPRDGTEPSDSLYMQLPNPRYVRCRVGSGLGRSREL